MNARAKSALRVELGLQPDDFVIINVAELNKNKNQQLIIKALPQILTKRPNTQVLFAGDDRLHGKLCKLAHTYGVGDRVRFLGYRGDLPQLFAISDLLVAASRREGLGLGLVEAMAAGLPALASDNRGHREVAAKKQLFRNNDTADLANKIAQLSSQDNSKIVSKFSLKNSLDIMNKIYSDILGSKYER
jgi:glycosyltransferase EpsD